MEPLLTVPQALVISAIGLLALYLIVTVKPQESADDTLEVSEGNHTTPQYLERYGAVIQSQQYH